MKILNGSKLKVTDDEEFLFEYVTKDKDQVVNINKD